MVESVKKMFWSGKYYSLCFFLQASEQATMVDLDDYLELLYDDLPAKIKGTSMILQLARTPDHLLDLASSGEIVCNSMCIVGFLFLLLTH